VKTDSVETTKKSLRLNKSMTRTKVALIAILLVSFLLSNYTNMTGSNWVIHPDDHEAYVLGAHLKETGQLSIDDPKNTLFEYPVFNPAGAAFYNRMTTPKRALGIYFVTAAGLFLGDQGPFYLVPLFGFLAMLFLFKLVELIMDEKKALLATFLVALSAPFLYWNNMLFANIPGLAFLIMGMYFLLRIAYGKDVRLRSYLFSTFFFGLAVWMRYEMLLVIVLLFPIVIGRREFFRLKRFAVGLLLLIIVLAPIGLLNSKLYDSPLGTGYSNTNTTQVKAGVNSGKTNSNAMGISRLYRRFLKNLLSPDVRKMYDNANNYLLRPLPMVLLAGLLGLVSALLDRRRNRSFAVAMLLVGIVWTYYVLNGSLWVGGGGSASSFVRYLLIVYVILAIFAPVFLDRLKPAVGGGAYRALLVIFIVSFLVLQITVLIGGPFGLAQTSNLKADFKCINEYFASAPENAVVVASLYSKAITSRSVFSVSNIKSKDWFAVTVSYIRNLLKRGYDVYLMEAPGYSSMFENLSNFITEKGKGLQVQTVTALPMRTASDQVERVVLVE